MTTQTSIPVLFQASFSPQSNWSSSNAVASVKFGGPGISTQPTVGQGDPCHFVAVFSRKNPTAGAVFHTVSSSNTTVPSGLDQYLTDQYILFWASATFITDMPQGALYDMLAKNGGGAQLKKMELMATSFACGIGSGLVYLLVSVPGQGVHGLEFLQIRSHSIGGTRNSNDFVYADQTSSFVQILELMPSPTGLYSPIEII